MKPDIAVTPINTRQTSNLLTSLINSTIFTVDLNTICSQSSLDYLALIADSYNHEWIEKKCKKRFASNNQGYNKASKYSYQDKEVKIHTGRFGNPNEVKIVIDNLQPFKTFEELRAFLTSVLGQKGIRNHKVQRVDISLLLPTDLFPQKLFRYSLSVEDKHGTYRSPHADKGDGEYSTKGRNAFSIGQTPERFSVYERPFDKPQEGALFDKGRWMTNFEVQLSKEKLQEKYQIYKLDDLVKLKYLNIYSQIKMYDVFKVDLPTRDRLENRFQSFFLKVLTDNFNDARKHANKQRNWDDSYQKYLNELKVGEQQILLTEFFNDRKRSGLTIFFKEKKFRGRKPKMRLKLEPLF